MDISYDAQAAVLGSLLLEPEKLTGEIMYRCKSSDFSTPELKRLFMAAQDLFLEDKPIDPVVLVAKVGEAYEPLVRSILVSTPTAANWEEYAAILRNQAMLNRLKTTANAVLDCTDARNAMELISEAAQQETVREGIKAVSIQNGLDNLIKWLGDKIPPKYLTWGIRPLDERLSVDAGDFIVLGADASVGKTAFALQLAYTMAESGKRVGLFSLETSDKKAYDRMFANLAGIKLGEIKNKRIDAEGVAKLRELRETIRGIKLDILHAPGASVADIRAATLTKQYDVIFIDYVQIVQHSGNARADIVANISMELHTMAQALGVTVIALSQLTPPDSKTNRFRQNHKEDLRESRQLINDADVIMIMSRTDKDNENYRELVIDKNKDGPLGVVPLDFVPELMKFLPHQLTRSESYRAVQKACREASRKKPILEELPDGDQLEIPEEFTKEASL